MPMTAARLQEYIDVYDISLIDSCVIIDDEEPGLIYGLGMLGKRKDRTWVTRLGVLPYARRLGVGGIIMSYLIERSYQLAAKELWLEVIAGNAPAHRLFVKNGFKKTRELIVSRRPPTSQLPDHSHCLSVRHADYLERPRILELLANRRRKPNWLNETESFINVQRLAGFMMRLDEGAQGWIVYESSAFQLKRVTIEVLKGDPRAVSQGMLYWLHKKLPRLDATSENIPTDYACWHGFKAVGYFDAFHRLEMVKKL